MTRPNLRSPHDTIRIQPDSGQILIGEEAANEAFLASGGYFTETDDIVTAMRPQIGNNPSIYPPIDSSQWTNEDFLAHAHWVGSLTYKQPENNPPSSMAIEKFGLAGFGGSSQEIYTRFGRLRDLHAALGYLPLQEITPLTKPTADDLLQAGLRKGSKMYSALTRSTKVTPEALAFRGQVLEHFDSIDVYLEQIGFPQTEKWIEGDFIDWGVATRQANDGSPITEHTIISLEARHRGPSLAEIYDMFGSLENFTREVDCWYTYQIEQIAESHRVALKNVTQATENEEKSIFGIIAATFSDPKIQARLGAQAMIVHEYFPEMPTKRVRRLLSSRSNSYFVKHIIEYGGSTITQAQLEIVAAELGVQEVLWPITAPNYLRVRTPKANDSTPTPSQQTEYSV